ncbi:hypothetical protein chiPu_0002635 [Chiloscyllium punctatum]|uniref:Uncharacterized protein n=1 Tax=Chiloscyllium punctatum TaxID=137246 RepID=A0A401S1G4_CHIPU|nr:hypothetical protein [Chiloscyllium punctatum]
MCYLRNQKVLYHIDTQCFISTITKMMITEVPRTGNVALLRTTKPTDYLMKENDQLIKQWEKDRRCDSAERRLLMDSDLDG